MGNFLQQPQDSQAHAPSPLSWAAEGERVGPVNTSQPPWEAWARD